MRKFILLTLSAVVLALAISSANAGLLKDKSVNEIDSVMANPSCGDTITQAFDENGEPIDTILTGDLLNCPGDGMFINFGNIII